MVKKISVFITVLGLSVFLFAFNIANISASSSTDEIIFYETMNDNTFVRPLANISIYNSEVDTISIKIQSNTWTEFFYIDDMLSLEIDFDLSSNNIIFYEMDNGTTTVRFLENFSITMNGLGIYAIIVEMGAWSESFEISSTEELRLSFEITSNSEYNSGYADGYNAGLKDGYDNGYDNGVNAGYDRGYGNGLTYGYNNGLNEGYNNGYAVGLNEGLSQAYNDAYNAGLSEGYNNGKNDGYADGYNAGLNETDATGFDGLLSAVFGGLGGLLAIEILPNIHIGAILAVPLVFGIIAFILGRRKDK